ncbi:MULTISPECIES: ISAs1 family transposase [unclassified Acidiphilium]|uniref:ISAs1 family transposase n=1 Tax=unclassified Acidiphilium TaxID=2617493 RepID=UPI000BC9D970|nr:MULTISPECIES: ISAs1 family transposase [unclassified Acidiphilium]OZB26682.1 MAG: ISAs1 family transposase [Acidiphilium sp. 34-64-41]
MSVRNLVEEFSSLKDPRCGGKVEHRLIDILVIAVCAVIAGAESWEDFALYGRSKQDWLGTFLALPSGIPSHDTFRRVFMLIDTGRFEACFESWARSFGATLDREVVAIDGKTIRGSHDRGREQAPLHVVSAWACDRRLVLGQRQVGDKSNEITAIPELLDVLDIKGAIVTLDAMGCQRSIASRIIERGADYLVTLKANQGKKFAAVQELCSTTCFSRSATHRPVHDEFDDGHGRLVRRRVFVCPDATALEPLRDWPGLKTVLAVETIRSVNGSGKTETDIRYFLSSSADQPEILAKAIRRHWQIENSLHWVLDVIFNEDHCRIRDRKAVQNFALLRKIAINLVRRHQASKASLKGRRKMAAWDNRYMEQVLTGNFHA